MKHLSKKLLSALLTLAIVLSAVSGLSAAAAGSYIYNTGARGEVCTSLSAAAQSYYTGSYTFENLSAQTGDTLRTSLRTLINSDRETVGYNGLKTYMKYTDCYKGDTSKIYLFYCGRTTTSTWDSAATWNREHMWPDSLGGNAMEGDLHSMRPTDPYINSTRGNLKYGNVVGVVSSYKTATGNASNGNAVGGYYGGGLFEPLDDVKGDCARVILYDYVVASSMSSVTVAFNDLETLLTWCEEDPVDQFEMGRNDSAESIEGCRNPFVDYPELAWILFGEEIPAPMQTPSGSVAEAGYTITAVSDNPNYGTVSLKNTTVTATPKTGYYADSYTLEPAGAATVTREGNTFRLSKLTSDVKITIHFKAQTSATVSFSVPSGVSAVSPIQNYVGNTVTLPSASGTPSDTAHSYTFVGWTDKPVTAETDLSKLTVYNGGGSYTITGSTTLYALYKYTESTGTGTPNQYVLVTANRSDWSGDYVIAGGSTYVLDASGTTTGDNLGKADGCISLSSTGATLSGSTISNMPTTYVYTIEKIGTTGKYSVKMHDSDNYLAWLSGNSLTTASSCAETSAQWTISYGDSAVYFANVATPSRILYFNSGANLFRCYTAAQSPISLYRGEGGSTTTYTTLDGTVADDCTNGHDWGEWVETKAATCTEQGEETRTCGRCGETETRKTDALGHDWDKGTVTKEATETETGEKTYTCLRCGEAKTEELPKAECPSAKFTDVDTSKWYHEGVDFAVSNGYIRGITDTTFEPNTPMNRGMLVTILYRVAGEPDVADTSIPFTDVAEGRYFTNAVKWAYSNNIVTGMTATTFEPQTPVTREQLATILYRYAGAEEVEEDLLKDFPDNASVHKYAQKAMNWAVSAGLITGNKADGVVYLDPAGSATRAQIAVILMRYLTTVA